MGPLSATGPSNTRLMLVEEARKGLKAKTGMWTTDLASSPLPEFGHVRSFGDKHSWVIDLDRTGITPSSIPDAVLDNATFGVDSTKEDSVTTCFKLQYQLFQSCVLKHDYICPASLGRLQRMVTEDVESKCWDYDWKLGNIVSMLNDENLMQLAMLTPVDQPAQYDDILDDNTLASTAKGNFTVPSY
jgi:hypothetical protein